MKVDLAKYNPLSQWQPHVGDWVVWAKLFAQWHGVISDHNTNSGMLSVIFAGMPYQLFSYTGEERAANTYQLSIDKIVRARPGTFAVLHRDVWYV